MPRKRKRPDWPQKVYKYRAYPYGEVPQEMWEIAELQQRLWNNLVALWWGAQHERAQLIERATIDRAAHEVATEAGRPDLEAELSQEASLVLWSYREKHVPYGRRSGGDDDVENDEEIQIKRGLLQRVLYSVRKTAFGSSTGKQRKEIQIRFDGWAKAAVALSGLDWEQGPAILDRLRATTSAVILRTGKRPRFHRKLDRISIAHRFTSGGLDASRLIDGHGRRVRLISSSNWQFRHDHTQGSQSTNRILHSPGNQHWKGRFRFGRASLDFALAFDRPLPDRAVVKRVTWLGQRSGLRWFWYLAITVEEPPREVPPAWPRPEAGIDIGWRLFADGTKHDYLRIGMVADSEGHTLEVRLPLNLRLNRTRERRGFQTLREWQSEADKHKDSAKTILASLEFPQDLQPLKSTLDGMGRRALGRLCDQFKERGLYSREVADILDEIASYDGYHNRMATLRFRLQERRTWYYRRIAHWFCERYGRIMIENMALQKLYARPRAAKVGGASTSDQAALKKGAPYRSYASGGALRAALKYAARQSGTEIVEGQPAGSTITCWWCGEKAVSGQSLELSCPGGHQWDQDKNAARNLLSRMQGTFRQPHDLSQWPRGGQWRSLQVPTGLESVVVEVPA